MIDTSNAALANEERKTFDVEVARFDMSLKTTYQRVGDDMLQFALKTQAAAFEGGEYPDTSNFVISFLRGNRDRKDRYVVEAPLSIAQPILNTKPTFTVHLEGGKTFEARVTDHIESSISASEWMRKSQQYPEWGFMEIGPGSPNLPDEAVSRGLDFVMHDRIKATVVACERETSMAGSQSLHRRTRKPPQPTRRRRRHHALGLPRGGLLRPMG